MKNNNFINGALLLLIGILNSIGLGVFVPGVKDFVEKKNIKSLKPIGYLPFVAMVILIVINFTGGIKPEDKKAIEETLEVVKVDTVKVDTLVVKLDSLKK